MRLSLRYDMRAPPMGAAPADLYGAAMEQAAWADRLGFDTVYLAEHHGAEDGYCPSPMVQAASLAARTRHMRIHLSALIGVLHHPLRVAEDLAVLDVISGGRLEVTLGIGYRPHEYAMFGLEQSARVRRLEDLVDVLRRAWTGEPFELGDQMVLVRPTPVQRPGPPLYVGGSTPASARRAAAIGDGFRPAVPGLYEIYEAARRRLGLDVAPPPPFAAPSFLYVTDDPERAWALVGPHVLYNTNTYAEWAKERGGTATTSALYPAAATVADLRRDPAFQVVTPDGCIELAQRLGSAGELMMQPLMGGLPPDVAWPSLELFAAAVLPRLVELGLREPAAGAAEEEEVPL